MKIAIIGLGLIGGSLGLSLKSMKLVDKIVGYDVSKQNEELALSLGLVEEIVTFQEAKKCDIIFLAIPVDAIIETLQKLTDIDKNSTIIDLGSTKEEILKSCPACIRPNLVAAHPMAGTENSGPKAAFKELLKNAVVVICEDEKTDKYHLKRAIEIFSNAGMKIVFMNAQNHDHHAAFISHLPHVISFSLVNSVLKEEDTKNIINLAGGSFSDMSRISKSSPVMWSEIFKQNRQNVLSSIAIFKNELEFCEKLIKEERWQELNDWIVEARKIREIL